MFLVRYDSSNIYLFILHAIGYASGINKCMRKRTADINKQLSVSKWFMF